MSKLAIVFPGQGAQHVGMGSDIYSYSDNAKAVYKVAQNVLGYDVAKLCFEGPEDQLRITEYTQPTILTTSFAMYVALCDEGIAPDVVAGLSLGEFTALVAAEALSFEQTVNLVRLRGKYMQEEVPDGVGGMAAILGLEDDQVEAACAACSDIGIVQAANYNCPKQLVIAGELKAVEAAVEVAKQKGARKAVMLPVSAPFHTALLKGAGDKLALALNDCQLNTLQLPVVANVDAAYYAGQNVIADKLIAQVSSPVKWSQSVKTMIADGVTTFIEVGPGKTLSKFIKKINKDVKTYNVCDLDSLKQTVAAIKNSAQSGDTC